MSVFRKRYLQFVVVLAVLVGSVGDVSGAIISFDHTDFGMTPVFNRLRDFDFTIDIAGAIVPGRTYMNPVLNSVNYNVFGILDTDPTPSGFPAFDLRRTITGSEFYAQGSSLSFSVSAAADLSDGLQANELVGTDPVFIFNGREVGTGRYHPALLQLNADGTGSIRNSNNMGGVNPGSNMVVEVDFGDEYIVNLSFTPSALTLATVTIPEPASAGFCAVVGLVVALRRRRA